MVTNIEPGDKVETCQGEYGYVVRPCESHMVYDWWIDIHFTAKGKARTCREPYRTEELEKIEESS